MLNIIVATARHNVIGRENQMPWHLPADLVYFKRITTGHPVIMGRKTFESIGRPLPHRRNIVVTRNANWHVENVESADSLPAAMAMIAGVDAFVIGGSQLYTQALPLADRVYLTEIDANIEGDTFFPVLVPGEWQEVTREFRPSDSANPYGLSFVVLQRIRSQNL